MPPLTGVRVLDCSMAMPGPFCTCLLADLGADVVKVEPPGGDLLRQIGPLFDSVNRSKRSLVLNLKAAEGQAIARRLAAGADLVVEQFRPGVAERIGIGYTALSAVNPALVYCSISGFGQPGPGRLWAGHDLNYLAMGGYLGLMLGPGRPAPPPVLVSDLVSGLYAAVALLAALEERRRTGRGQYIDLAMTDSVVALVAGELNQYHVSGRVAERPNVSFLPHYDTFATADGGSTWRPALPIAPGCTSAWRRLSANARETSGSGCSRRKTSPRPVWQRWPRCSTTRSFASAGCFTP